MGIRMMVVLLEDDVANPPNGAYCQSYADKYGLDTSKIIVAIDPLKKSQVYYESPVVSLSIITNRRGEITYKDEINNPSAFKWQVDFEIKAMCDELASPDNEDVYTQEVVDTCAAKKKEIPPVE